MSRRKRERNNPLQDEQSIGGHRHARLQTILGDELDALLRDELGDPDLASVRFAGVELSVDYRTVRVRFFIAGGAGETERESARALRAFERAGGFIRRRLDEALDLKRVPELRFIYDRDAAAADRAARILDEESEKWPR